MARGRPAAISARNRKFAPKDGNKAATSVKSLTQAGAAAIIEYTSVKNTDNAYNRYLARGRDFLKDLVEKRANEEQTSGPNEDGICTAVLAKAFDESGPPNEYSALALEMFLVEKCFNEGCGHSTAEGIHGAFAAMWDHMDSGCFSGPYSFDKDTREVKGCPARESGVKSVVHAVKVRDKEKGAAATRSHAQAMTVEDLQKIMTWSEKVCPPDSIPVGVDDLVQKLEHGFMRAFLSSGFVLWTRCFELLDLQPSDIQFDCVGPPPHNLPHFKVELLNRKGWQNEKGYEGARDPHVYNIYPQANRPEMDMYKHLLDWRSCLEAVLKRPLTADEYWFPHIGRNGVIRPDRKMTYDTLMKLLVRFCEQAGVDRRYTTHSLRRGGAQYRFMYGPYGQRWDLNRIRWWGGWAVGEHCETLIKYLVDSLQNVQNDHGDALNPFEGGARTDADYFMGHSDGLNPPSKEEWRAATTATQQQIAATHEKIGACIEAVHLLSTNRPVPQDLGQVLPAYYGPMALGQPGGLCITSGGTNISAASTTLLTDSASTATGTIAASVESQQSEHQKVPRVPRSVPLPHVSIPDLGRKPGAWRRALKQWTDIDPKTGIALMDWPLSWYTGGMSRITGSLRGQRELLFQEYHRLGGTDHAFLSVYPNADVSLKRLIDAIRSNPNSNTGRRRTSKNGTPEARSSFEPQSREASTIPDSEGMDISL